MSARRHLTDRRGVSYVLFVASGLAVLSPVFPEEMRDDFPLSPYGMFAEDKDETTTVTHAVAVLDGGDEAIVPPAMLGTDEVLQARATLAKAARSRPQANTLCARIAARVAEEGDLAAARRVEIRTVTYDTLAYFADPKAPPKRKRVHVRCAVAR